MNENSNMVTQSSNSEAKVVKPHKNKDLAAFLSLLMPGVGQLYNARYWWALIWFGAGVLIFNTTAGTLWFLANVGAAIHAYRQAKDINSEG